MDEIRFSPFNRERQNESVQPAQESFPKRPKSLPIFKNFLKALILVLILGVLIWGGIYVWRAKSGSLSSDPTASEYYAVFLTNGQVYFGKPVSKSRSEFVLSDVYYLQASGNTTDAQDQLNQPRFSLVKLGQEVHGPTDKLFINMTNVLFYEQLKNDSQVVKSIINQN